jgi:hypothetical protein
MLLDYRRSLVTPGPPLNGRRDARRAEGGEAARRRSGASSHGDERGTVASELRKFQEFSAHHELRELRGIAMNLYRYSEVGARLVAPAKQLCAARVMSYCAKDLGVAELPELKWFRPESAGERAYFDEYGKRAVDGFGRSRSVIGLFQPGALYGAAHSAIAWIAAHLDGWDLVATVAHEMRHAAQSPVMPHNERERDAREYERTFRP